MAYAGLKIFGGLLAMHLAVLGPALLWQAGTRRHDLESFTEGLGVGIAGFALVAWLCFILGVSLEILWGFPVLGVVALVARRGVITVALRRESSADLLVAYALLSVFFFLALALVHGLHGGGWSFDWFEHYIRALYLADGCSMEVLQKLSIQMTSRPPLANAFAAGGMALLGTDFFVYQMSCAFLGALNLFPLVLFVRRFFRSGTKKPADAAYGFPTFLLTMLLMMSPVFVNGTLYTWTRMPTTFFVLLGLYLFFRPAEKPCARSRVSAFVFLSFGMLAHYSVGPYIVTLGMLYALTLFQGARRGRCGWVEAVRELLLCFGSILAVLSVWVGWAITRFGLRDTFLSNSSVQEAAHYSMWENVFKVLANVWDSISPFVPPPLHLPETMDMALLIALRNTLFLNYQGNLLFCIGSLTPLVLLWHAWKTGALSRLNVGLLAWVAGTVLLSIAVVGGKHGSGLAHVGLHPLAFIVLSYAAVQFRGFPPYLRWVFGAGIVLDYALGLVGHLAALHIYPQSLVGVVQDLDAMKTVLIRLLGSPAVANNMVLKSMAGLVFVGDLVRVPLTLGLIAISLVPVVAGLLALRKWRA